MNRLLRPRNALWLALFLFSHAWLSAQEQGSFLLAAGGIDAAGGGGRVSGTIGQPIIGVASSSGRIAWQGFWVPGAFGKVSTTDQITGTVSAGGISLSCSPNPVSSSATISLSLPGTATISLTLYDGLGREVSSLIREQSRSGDLRLRLDTEGYSSGWYTLILSAGEERITYPLHIVR